MFNLLEELVRRSVITKADAALVRTEAEKTGTSFEEVLVSMGVPIESILAIRSEHLGVPSRVIGKDEHISGDVLKNIAEESAAHYKLVPIAVRDGVLEVGMVDPDDIEARDALNFISSKAGLPFKIFLISEGDFKRVVDLYKGLTSEVTQALSELESEGINADEGVDLTKASRDDEGKIDTRIIEDAPVTKIVATILRYATEGNASDVHIEPMRDNVRVRFRVDGILNTSLVLPTPVLQPVVARIKVLSNMKLDEKRKPQDGRFSAHIGGRKIDFRVSTFPTYFGEKVVMRILDQERGVKRLDDMGLTPRNLDLMKKAIDRPYGLILISGPTGSGKTTTLYSMLKEVDRDGSNVLSLEDPIEYNVEGMNQSQVHAEIGYTFANGLRTALRQDPDIIMVGEIRDKETAELAVQAALTGHLVFSTIHTNNAAGVIPRLIDMGIDPYLIAPTLVLAISQRLVRLRAQELGIKNPVEGDLRERIEKEMADIPEPAKSEIEIPEFVYDIESSATCPTGCRGRAAAFEIISMDRELEALVLKSPSEQEIMAVARKSGMMTVREDALLKAFQGDIPFEEVLKL